MNRLFAKRMAARIILLILAAMFILYACRQYVLHRIADRRIAEMEQRFQLKVGYESLKLEGCNVVCLRGLSVIPEDRDTIVTLKHLDIRLDLWKMLTGNIQIKEVNMDYLHINLQKDSTVANYDFLFRSSGKASETSAEASEANYAQRAHRILNWIYERIPDNGSITKLLLTERHDSHTVQFRLPELNIKDNRFETLLHVTEDSLNRQSWNITGLLSPSERNLHVKIHSTQDFPVKLPYLQRRFNTDIRFDTLTCSLTEIPDGRNQTSVKGLAELSGLNLFQPAISPDTIQLDKGALEYRLNISANAVELDSTSCIKFNQLTFHPYIRLENTHVKSDKPLGNWHFTAQINEPWFPAQQLFGSLPQGLFDSLYGLKTEGELSYHGLLDVDFNLLDSLKLESELKKRNFRIVHMGQANLCKMNDEFEYTAYEDGVPVRNFPVGPSWEHFTPLDSISPLLQMAVMQSEDGAFFYHNGFLIDAMREAIIKDLEVRKFARGGSTISMQLVKNVFLNRKKNIARKIEEALIVWLIENQRLSTKERMFEVYMNIIEWGPLVYGAREASEFYFNKRPSQLTAEEAIYMASIIPKPKRFKSSFDENGQLRESLEGYYRLIAHKLAQKGLISESKAESIRPVIHVTGPAKAYLSTDTLNISNR